MKNGIFFFFFFLALTGNKEGLNGSLELEKYSKRKPIRDNSISQKIEIANTDDDLSQESDKSEKSEKSERKLCIIFILFLIFIIIFIYFYFIFYILSSFYFLFLLTFF